MPLTIEDGSGVAGANSYATHDDARAYASARGIALSSTDSVVEALLIKAADFLDSLEDRYKGTRIATTQALAWPRSGVYLFNSLEPLPDNQLPAMLKKAQCQLTVDLVSVELQPTGDGREVLQKTIGPLTTVYAQRSSGSVVPQPNKALSILEPLFKTSGLNLRTIRA